MKQLKSFFLACALLPALAATACAQKDSRAAAPSPSPSPEEIRLAQALAFLPEDLAAPILARSTAFLADIAAIPAGERALLILVDKAHSLPDGYAPTDLVPLPGTGLSLSRQDLSLRKPCFEALKAMDAAARLEGVSFLISSSYRSYNYQKGVWDRSEAAYGKVQTAREVAWPGQSQHQLGTAVDFGPIDDSFALTKASQWLVNSAVSYGFSLSFPEGLEDVTGYRYESWHYRFIGSKAAAIQEAWFGGVQQYL
ncbi:MAG: hypothetical protein A2095_14000, partial [Sphingomonadales bacterium GWF1_63_6]